MNYKVLYRKYRPNNFTEVVGQKNTIKLLQDSIINDKVAHAYIFSGPRGTGKTSTAKIFAKTLNCSNLKDGNPCEECEQCKNFSTSSDIYEIDAASNNGVDQIREIIDNIKLLPINSKYKIYIIDEVHMLSASAFNALLLTLEEPPSHVIFILATTNVEAIPITIISRCQRLNFQKISNNDLIDNMRNISKLENISITDDALNEIAVYSDGGMRDALSVLDQLSKLNTEITLELVQNELGFISNHVYEELIDYVETKDVDSLVKTINDFKNNAIDFKMSVKKILEVLKKKCIYSLNNNSTLSFDDYKKIAFNLANSLNNINVNINSYDLMELLFLEYMSNQTNTVVPRENKNEIVENIEIGNNSKKEKIYHENLNNFDKIKDIRINNCFVNCNKNFKQEFIEKWNEFKNDIKDRKIKSLINETTIVAASDTILLILCNINDQVDLINDISDDIAIKFNEMFDKNIKICCLEQEKWDLVSKECVQKIKNGEKYQYIDENVDVDDNINICDVFDTSVVEVK